jgi:DNA adenine methylase
MNYPGGKNRSGVYQRLINLMPPHQTYIEAFLGSGAVMRNKKPADQNIGIELDALALVAWKGDEIPNLKLVHGNALKILASSKIKIGDRTLIYCDPPYPSSVRLQARPIYRCEMMNDSEHIELIGILKSLGCMVMLSGYAGSLYNRLLSGWRRVEYQTTNRAGHKVTECVWLNFPEPLELHDYRFLGKNFRERERIKRKRFRWQNRLETMNCLERHALMAEIEDLRWSIARNGASGPHRQK